MRSHHYNIRASLQTTLRYSMIAENKQKRWQPFICLYSINMIKIIESIARSDFGCHLH